LHVVTQQVEREAKIRKPPAMALRDLSQQPIFMPSGALQVVSLDPLSSTMETRAATVDRLLSGI